MAEAVLETLLSAVRDHGQHPEAETDSAPLNTALVIAVLQSGNPKLCSLVVLYLEFVGTEHAKQLISTLIEMEESDQEFVYDTQEVGNNSQVGLNNHTLFIQFLLAIH